MRWLGLVLCVLALGCQTLPLQESIDPAKIQRVISLAPNITEWIYALGAEAKLVAVTDDCNYPAEAKALPKTGKFGSVTIERILELNPDLVIYSDLPNPQILEALNQKGIQTLKISIQNWTEWKSALAQLALIFQKKDLGQKLLDQADLLLNADVHSLNKPRLLIEIWGEPQMAAGPQSFLNALILSAGAKNVLSTGLNPFPIISTEQILQLKPEIVLKLHSGSSPIESVGVLQNKWPVKILTPPDLDVFLRAGPRSLQALEWLRSQLPHAH